MAPKMKKRRVAEKKKPEPEPLDVSGAYGYVADDVAAAVDWQTLRNGLDKLMESKLWAMGIDHKKVIASVALGVAAESKAKRVSLLEGVLGAEAAASASGAAAAESADAASATPPNPQFVVSSKVSLRKVEGKGRGWFA